MSGKVDVDSPFLDTEGAAKFLKVPKSTIYYWSITKKYKFPIRKVGKRSIFIPDELMQWLLMRGKGLL